MPELTTVSTFDSFVYHQLVLPYEPSIAEHFGCPKFVSRGICTVDPPPQTIRNSKGKPVANPLYKKKDRLAHYVTMRGQYYCATLSELVLQVKKNRESLIKRVAARLNMFYDCVLIDEFQDFREHDYELIMALAKQLKDVVLVGDYHQHSVSATNNSGKPFKNKKGEVSYDDFVASIIKEGFTVDASTLAKSRRCSMDVCDYVSRKLGIEITSNGDHSGAVKWIDGDPSSVLDDDRIIKLVFREAGKYSFPALNWSYSKGDTVDSACVILTDELDNLDSDKFDPDRIRPSTLNKLYVAMTRSRGDLYLMKASTFKAIRDSYLALPALVNVVSATEIDDAWDAIIELMYDDDAKAFVELARDTGVPAPAEDNIGYEVEGDDGEVIATVEIAWPDKHVGFMTADQAEDKEKLENMGWKILNLLDATDMDTASLFGGDN